MLLVKLKNLHISACLNLNYGAVKQKPKKWEVQEWCVQYSYNFDFGYFLSSIIPFPPSVSAGAE